MTFWAQNAAAAASHLVLGLILGMSGEMGAFFEPDVDVAAALEVVDDDDDDDDDVDPVNAEVVAAVLTSKGTLSKMVLAFSGCTRR